MKNLKLNKLNRISNEMKNAVKGGENVVCSCGCCGPSSVEDNRDANTADGFKTKCEKAVAWGVLIR